jgi:hypothetical protein
MADLAGLIMTQLTDSGHDEMAEAFGRMLRERFAVQTNRLTVRDVKDNFSSLLSKVRDFGPTAICPYSKLEDAVVLISLRQLAEEIGEIAVGLSNSPAAEARNPMTMLARVDRLPSVSGDIPEINVWHQPTRHVVDLE